MDLIDRQAAVDAAYQYISQFDAIDADFLDGLKEAINIVKKLPSAQHTTCKYWDTESDFCALYRPSAQPEIIRCKDCKHRMVNAHFGEREYISLKAMCELDTGDPFELGRCAENDEWFCADAERRTDGM